jgi:hypothetical protein
MDNKNLTPADTIHRIDKVDDASYINHQQHIDIQAEILAERAFAIEDLKSPKFLVKLRGLRRLIKSGRMANAYMAARKIKVK